MNEYRAYTLGIRSELPLPELTVGEASADVTIRCGQVNHERSPASATLHWAWATPQEAVLYWHQVGAFWIRRGEEIVIDPDPTAPAERVRLFLLGAALGVLLQQRGYLVFHASAVAIKGGAVLFVGDKGWGKSTMTALLHAWGHPMLADDVAAIEYTAADALVLPGFPQLKLWPDALATIGQAADACPPLHPAFEKRDYRITTGFAERPLLLRCIYLLDHGPQPTIEPVEAGQALLELLPHWYCARFGSDTLQRLGYATHFRQCAKLAGSVPLYRLRRPRCLATLPAVAQLVEKHCALIDRECG